jgi:hypothetical protein
MPEKVCAMVNPSLKQLEQEVEAARAKLGRDLLTLRSPDTTAQFTESLKQEAIAAKDTLLEKAKAGAQSSVETLMHDLKARAAANPAAALAIGAGIAWRLIRHPPIATALVGAGLVSLLRTPPANLNGRSDPGDYLSHAKDRLVDQAAAVAEMTKDRAVAVTERISEKVQETASEVRDRMQDMGARLAQDAKETVGTSQARASAMWNRAAETLNESGQSARATAATASSRAVSAADQLRKFGDGVLSDPEPRDKLLLGAAGLAVLTALGVAFQRRFGTPT